MHERDKKSCLTEGAISRYTCLTFLTLGPPLPNLVYAIPSEQICERFIVCIVWMTWVVCVGQPHVFFEEMLDLWVGQGVWEGAVVDHFEWIRLLCESVDR